MFPIQAKDGDIWVYSKISFKQPDEEGYRNMIGYLQCIDNRTGEMNENIDFLQVNSLLYQQNSISSLFYNRMILHRLSIKYWQISSNRPKETAPIYLR